MVPDISYETILVPTDGSQVASEAVDHAIDLANRYGATLHAFYVVETPGLAGDVDTVSIQEALEAQGEDVLRGIAGRAEAADLTVETALRHGTPHREILQYADEAGVDLIVMGTHGRRGFERYLLGSVTEKVVRLSDVPVMTVTTAGDGEAGEESSGE